MLGVFAVIQNPSSKAHFVTTTDRESERLDWEVARPNADWPSEAAPGLHLSRRDFSSDVAVCLGCFVTARAICLLSRQTLTLFWMMPK